MKTPACCVFETSLGWCGIAWRESPGAGTLPAVVGFQLPEQTRKLTAERIARKTGARLSASQPAEIARIIRGVCDHLKGDLRDFRDVPVDFNGVGPFARQVYEAARKIPAGQTRTYGELAKACGRPTAARAVGQALGKNPVALIVPCHRILAAGGRPGGFSAYGGWNTKARMLEIEGAGRALSE